jgi:hypothetical protein
VKDEPLYYLKGRPDALPEENYAVEMHFLTSGQNQLTRADWDKISQGMVAMPLSAFDDFNAEIAKLCSEVTCNYEVQQKIDTLVFKLHNIR